jgi:hypothetical protein
LADGLGESSGLFNLGFLFQKFGFEVLQMVLEVKQWCTIIMEYVRQNPVKNLRCGFSIDAGSYMYHCGQAKMECMALPAGVRFDPSDEELLIHLAAKMGHSNMMSHPLIDDFISFLDGEDGICGTHPEKLPGNNICLLSWYDRKILATTVFLHFPLCFSLSFSMQLSAVHLSSGCGNAGVKKDGSSCHFFHRPSMAYTTGTRKRRKIHANGREEVRWHKTGKTRPVLQVSLSPFQRSMQKM